MVVKEVVLFRVRKEAVEGFDALSSAMDAFLATQKGFISRSVLRDVNDPSSIIDLVEWESLEDAIEAAKAVEVNAATLPFIGAIETIVSMSHYTAISKSA